MTARGHGYFKAIPYAFGWLGASGLNPHTPPAVAAGRRETDSAVPYLPVMRWSSQDDYQAWRAVSRPAAARRLAAETDDIPTAPVFTLPGFCAVCEAPASSASARCTHPATCQTAAQSRTGASISTASAAAW